MQWYSNRKPTSPGALLADKGARRRFVANKYNKPMSPAALLADKGARQDTEPLFQNKGEELEGSALPYVNKQDGIVSEKKSVAVNEQEMPLSYYIRGLVHVVRRRLRTMSLPSQIVLASIVLYLMTVILTLLIQFVIGSISVIYTVLGILASAIVIYEFFLKKR